MSERAPLPARLQAPAKLTTRLTVTGVRADGYHLIDAEMVTLDLVDDLELTEGSGVRFTGSNAPIDLEGGGLVAEALALVGRDVSVTVEKRIPAGAGLGGGSSDAAAILRWAGWDQPERAVGLGADVPFCLVGGRARVTGIGETIEVLPFRPMTFTLLTPPIHCSTPAVYRRWDELGGPRHSSGNDLLPAAVSAYPELAGWIDRFGDAAGVAPRLAGSGSTLFVEGVVTVPGSAVTHALPSEWTYLPRARRW